MKTKSEELKFDPIVSAKGFLLFEKNMMLLTGATPVIFVHKGMEILGSVAHPIPGEPEITLCAHASQLFMEKEKAQAVAKAIMKLNPDRKQYIIDDELELAERQDVMRMVGNRLTKMTPEQTEVASEFFKNVNVAEI